MAKTPDRESLLRLLHAHGQQFLEGFQREGKRKCTEDSSERQSKRSKADLGGESRTDLYSDSNSDSDHFEEWGGIQDPDAEDSKSECDEGVFTLAPLLWFNH
jgi:hypothetical protein